MRRRHSRTMQSNAEWREWGKRDPLYGVAAWPGRERGGSNPWTAADFYETGALDWAEYRSHWQHYGLDLTRGLDVGCGAGRLTEPMSRDFDAVDAVDVSADILGIARARIPDESVSFHLTDGLTIPLAAGSTTAVFCNLVFQHFDDVDVAAEYLRELYRVMGPAATLMLQLPLWEAPSAGRLIRGLYGTQRLLGGIRARIRRRRMARGGQPIMRLLRYELVWVYRTLATVGLDDIQVRIFRVRSNGDHHSFVFARRSS